MAVEALFSGGRGAAASAARPIDQGDCRMKTSLTALVAMLAVAALVPAQAAPRKTENVVLIISDGLRWQELFTGADPLLLNDEKFSWTPVAELKQKYWHEDPRERRKLLFPFIWGTVAKQGQLLGNQLQSSRAEVTNRYWFSYPGYNEMSSGRADPRIDTNEFGPNPNVTVFEWLNSRPAFKGKVEVFGAWSVFHDIFNGTRSHLPIRAGATLVDRGDRSPQGRLLEELYRTTTRIEGDDPLDSFVHVALRTHLRSHRPRVLFVGYGDTDSWGHMGRYDALLDTAHSFDEFVGDLWRQMQALPEYRGKTTFILTCDHGRGSGAVDWKDHGVGQPGSANIWMAVIGPDTLPLGERHDTPTVTQSQIAATVAAFVGEDFRAARPEVAPSLLDVLAAGAGGGAH